MIKTKILIIFLLTLGYSLSAQIMGDHNHPELKWYTFETEHFIFHYHKGTEFTANKFANVGDKVYDVVTDLYSYEPEEKIHIIVNDYDDYANGGAFYYNNKISLWAPNLDTELRGTHDWFKNVFTHEFTHMIQLQTSMKMSTITPGVYLQWTSYENEKRKDVLTGYPNVLSSYNIPMNIIPGWFAEGVAQNQNPDTLNFDFIDSHRDMIFRERILTGKQFSYDKLSDFGNKSSHEAETVYNTGMHFLRYIFDKYGKHVPEEISRNMSGVFSFSFETAIEKATGKRGPELYQEFLDYKKKQYLKEVAMVEDNLVEGKDISDSAFVNTHPQYSPDGKYLAYLSTKLVGEVTFYRRTLYVKDLAKDSVVYTGPTMLFSSYSWSPDSKFIYYSKHDEYSLYGNAYLDIYRYDLEEEEEERITYGKRACNPAVSPDSSHIAYVASADGSQNLFVLDLKTNKIKNLSRKKDGTQYYLPKWTKDGTRILTAHSAKHYGRDLAVFDTSGVVLETYKSDYDMRNPVFSDDEKQIYYSSDETGIFNIYRLERGSGKKELLTNVRGGAFYPEVQGNSFVYANYKGIKFQLYQIDNVQPLEKDAAVYNNYTLPRFYDIAEKDYLKGSERYLNDFEHVFIVPRIAVDGGKFKPGIYFFLNDYLNQISLFGGANMNLDQDYDIFGITEFKFLLPTIYAMGINVVRHDKSIFDDQSRIKGFQYDFENDFYTPLYEKNDIEYTYDLKEFNIGLKFPINYSPMFFGYPLGKINIDMFYAYAENKAQAKYDNFSLTYTYLKDNSYNLNVGINLAPMGFDSDINPSFGRSIMFSMARHKSKFFKEFDVDSDYGTLKEVYSDNNYNRIALDWKEYLSLPLDMGLSVKVKASYLHKDGEDLFNKDGKIEEESLPDFYNDYIGGLTGLRGYSFYSLGGTRTYMESVTLRFPIIKRIDKKIGFFNFKKLFGAVFYESGKAWRDNGDEFKQSSEAEAIKSDVGINLRLYGVSFYGMPTAIDYSLAYGLDEFTLKDGTKYGKSFRSYLTVLFNFLDF